MFIDAHTHILPGIDDGAQTLDEAMSMLILEREAGVSDVYLTPHVALGGSLEDCRTEWEHIESVYEEVVDLAREKVSGLNLHLGAELYYTSYTAEYLRKLNGAMTLGDSRYVLVEFDTDMRYEDILRGLRKLTNEGYIPVLAHFERYECLYREQKKGLFSKVMRIDRERLMELICIGVKLQINANTLANEKEFQELFSDGMIDTIGSDCHRMDWRPPNMGIVREYGEDLVLRGLI